METPKDPDNEIVPVMETPKDPENEIVPVTEYIPKQRSWAASESKSNKKNPIVKVIGAVVAAVLFSGFLYYMGYKIAEEALVHTAYEIATTTAEQTQQENSQESYRNAVAAKAFQIANEKKKDQAFILKGVDVIPAENSNIRLIAVTLEGRFLFSTINVSWWSRP